jgi:hypothetical protein
MADVRLGRSQVIPIGAEFGTMSFDDRSLTTDSVARVRQQLANPRFRFFVVALAEVVFPHLPRAVEEVQRRPVLVGEAMPDRAIVINGDWVLDAPLLDGTPNILNVLLE